MEMQQVRYFLALCKEQNFTRAAKVCGIKQPTLTRAIKNLEAEFGGPLFERSRKTTRPTNLGVIVWPYIADIDRSVTNAMRVATKSVVTPMG